MNLFIHHLEHPGQLMIVSPLDLGRSFTGADPAVVDKYKSLLNDCISRVPADERFQRNIFAILAPATLMKDRAIMMTVYTEDSTAPELIRGVGDIALKYTSGIQLGTMRLHFDKNEVLTRVV